MRDPYGDGNGPIENVVPFRGTIDPSIKDARPDDVLERDPLHAIADKTLIQALFRRGLLRVACAGEIVAGEIDAQYGSDEDFQHHVKLDLAQRLGVGLADEGFIINDKKGTGQGSRLHEDQAHSAYVAVLVPGEKRDGA